MFWRIQGSSKSGIKTMTNSSAKSVLITGANRGIGKAMAKHFGAHGFHVIVAARDEAKAKSVAAEINSAGGKAETLQLDMSSSASIAAAGAALAKRHKSLDVLVNNAGVMLGAMDSIIEAKQDDITASLQTNAFGPLELTKAVLPLLQAAPAARVVNVSSAAGSIAETADPKSPYGFLHTASYRLSKSSMNIITAMLAKSLWDSPIKVNAMCPGWTKTDMGGDTAPNSPEQGAAVAFKLATLGSDGPTGGFFNEHGPLGW
jgi:NAD(P)-dependent dehydrogenase (short-subunit alcohol dehydrogenase family)